MYTLFAIAVEYSNNNFFIRIIIEEWVNFSSEKLHFLDLFTLSSFIFICFFTFNNSPS